MKIISWNVNGLRAVMSKNFAEFVEAEKPDILCLQETRISMEIVDSLSVPFVYKVYSCAEKKGYSGTAIFSNVEPLEMREIALEGHPEEGRITLAKFAEFTLVNVYVPNSQNGLRRLDYRTLSWDVDFRKFIKTLGAVIVCGDFNVAREEIDVCDPKDAEGCAGYTQNERDSFAELLRDDDLCDVWREKNPQKIKYTWWSYFRRARQRNVGWRIDYFLVSRELSEKVKDAELLNEIGGSDHCPISIELDL